MSPQVPIFSVLEEYNSYVARSLILYIEEKCVYSGLFDSGVTSNSKILISNLPRWPLFFTSQPLSSGQGWCGCPLDF